MKGFKSFRLRAGDYRVIYQFDRGENTLMLITVGTGEKSTVENSREFLGIKPRCRPNLRRPDAAEQVTYQSLRKYVPLFWSAPAKRSGDGAFAAGQSWNYSSQNLGVSRHSKAESRFACLRTP